MQLEWIYFFTTLHVISIAHVCDDDWELVDRKNGPSCWKLLDLPDFSAGYNQSLGVCQAASAQGVEVQNFAEKAVLADLANRVVEPTLTCYKVAQSALEGHLRNVDYERPPEYLRKINEEGRVRLGKKIELHDRITIGFSTNMRPEGSKPLNLTTRIRIGNSSDPTKYCVEIVCTLEPKTLTCKYTNPKFPANQNQYPLENTHVGHFVIFTFDFLDNRIDVLGVNVAVSEELSYETMDEISVENMIVTILEHSKACQKMSPYLFNVKRITKQMPKDSSDVKHIPAPRRSLGSNYTLSVPPYFFDLYRYQADSPWIFDVRISRRTSTFVQVELWNREGTNSTKICHFRLEQNKMSFEKLLDSGKTEESMLWDNQNCAGDLASMRLEITSNAKNKMQFGVTFSCIGIPKNSSDPHTKRWPINEIRLFSDTAIFFEPQLTPLEVVSVTTCSYREKDANQMQETVPFRSECFKKRNILCQKDAQNRPNKVIPDEKEQKVWQEQGEKTTQSVFTTSKAPPRNATGGSKNLRLLADIQLENIDGFQWCIISLTSLSAASIIAIFVLNIIRCGL